MKAKTTKKYLDKIWEKTFYHLDRFMTLRNQEDIHQFRVNVKKLNAVLTVFSQTPKNQNLLNHLKPVRKIFKQAGKIREAYIHLQMAQQHQLKLPRFVREQQELMFAKLHRFRNRKNKLGKIIKRSRKVINQNLHSISTKNLVRYYQTQFDQIVLILAKQEFNDQMHFCRKQIKSLLYTYKIAQKSIGKKINLDQVYLDQLQQILGDWHDAVLSLELFSSLKLNADLLEGIKSRIINSQQAILLASNGFWIKATHSKVN